ncbi:universal stress protein [Nocardia spumae]|uniref:universal stress protein n=1 Tax=Nocardia spumae TaxID=2887190 RepID=UPI001D138D0A|nr:universal stress protein [Nocardia spumae]
MTVEQSGSATAPIVVAVDGSPTSLQAVAWAARDAALSGHPLRIVHSIAVPAGFGPGLAAGTAQPDWLRTDGEQILSEAAASARELAGPDVVIDAELSLELVIGDLLVRSEHAYRMVAGSRGRGALRRGLLGSVSSALVHHARCPVVVVKDDSATDAAAARRPVLVGVDGTDNSDPATGLAFEEAQRRGVALVALHSWSDTTGLDISMFGWDTIVNAEHAMLAQRLAPWRDRYPEVPVTLEVARDDPGKSLLKQSDSAQLAVVGSRGRGGFAGMLLGSTSAGLVHSAECPIMVVRR